MLAPEPFRRTDFIFLANDSPLNQRAVLDQIAGPRLVVAADLQSGESLKRVAAAVAASPKLKDRVRFLAGVDFRNVGPGWAERAITQLRADLGAGAVGIGEIAQNGEAEMPPKKEPLHDFEIQLIRKWISEGAVDDTPSNARQRISAEHPPVYQRPPVVTSKMPANHRPLS